MAHRRPLSDRRARQQNVRVVVDQDKDFQAVGFLELQMVHSVTFLRCGAYGRWLFAAPYPLAYP